MAEGDIGIIAGILTTMFLLAFIIPFVQDAFGESQTSISTDNLENNIGQGLGDETNYNTLTAFSLLKSVVLMFFWTYSFLPVWLQVMHLIIRVILVLLCLKYIPFVGG